MSDKSSPFEGLYVVAKFFMSRAPDGTVHCISRTLGKLAIIDQSQPSQVQHKEIWLCRILKEVKPGQNSGAFIMETVKKIDPARVRKIIPGYYDVVPAGRAALIRPNEDRGAYWMLSKITRSLFSDKYYAVVVPVEHLELTEDLSAQAEQIPPEVSHENAS